MRLSFQWCWPKGVLEVPRYGLIGKNWCFWQQWDTLNFEFACLCTCFIPYFKFCRILWISLSIFFCCCKISRRKWEFVLDLLALSQHTHPQQSEGRVELIQSHIWTFCKTSILHNPPLTRGKNKRTQRDCAFLSWWYSNHFTSFEYWFIYQK